MIGKALYNNSWFEVANINFDTGHIIIKNDNENSLGLRIGKTLTLDLDYVDDVKIGLLL
ncbi:MULTISPECIES: hypothetical protein [Bacillus amyloliquefaciens group]|uniref:hypothetical protein n=1 Tax=Bacillus amyloliquefaciens group TaxID=1938374 RepID=UPI0010C522A6|nr:MULTISPECIES: hypothetical protein [Bacillus amyloliquefaciens group]QBG56532.1 hypothetical protein D2M30_2203 [Bacillus amyloliquefaciens]